MKRLLGYAIYGVGIILGILAYFVQSNNNKGVLVDGLGRKLYFAPIIDYYPGILWGFFDLVVAVLIIGVGGLCFQQRDNAARSHGSDED